MRRSLTAVFIALTLLPAITMGQAWADDGTPPRYAVTTITLGDGALVDQTIIAGPPNPPPGYELERAPVALPKTNMPLATVALTVPAYAWSFGCSATSGAMIAGYYDRTGFANMYTGPTDGGVMPLDSSSWGTWSDGTNTYAQCPVTASRQGLDGRTTRGSINDYWVSYGSSAQDPYITGGWTQHTWSTAVGDYMKTSQSASGNTDGATTFYTWSSSSTQLTCANMVSYGIHTADGTYGRKLFYEARGYTVTNCYNQKTDNNGGGFTLALYKAEIDAGRPVMLNLLGHTVVGVGYDTASNTVYIHDTWDYLTHSMTWGGSYSGMALQSVSVVDLVCPATAAVGGLAIARVDDSQVAVTWAPATGAAHYEIWYATGAPYFTPGADCDHPGAFGCAEVTGTSFLHASLGSPAANTSYAVRAVSACGAAPSLSTGRVGEFEYDMLPGD